MSAVGRRSLAGIVGLAVGVAGLAFVGIRIARDWDQIVETMRSANPAWLFAAVIAGLVSMTLIAVNWLSLIERRGHATSLSTGLSWFFSTNSSLDTLVPLAVSVIRGRRAALDSWTL